MVYYSYIENFCNENTPSIEDCVVILTMTVNPMTRAVGQKKTNDRIIDYRKSINQWLKMPQFKVIAIENSGAGIEPFKDILKNAENIQYFSTNLKHLIKYEMGKGYGEAITLKWGLENVPDLKNNKFKHITKCTGRVGLYPESRLSFITNSDVVVVGNVNDKRGWCKTSVLSMKSQYFPKFIEFVMQTNEDQKLGPERRLFENQTYKFIKYMKSMGKTIDSVNGSNIKLVEVRNGTTPQHIKTV